MIEVRNLSKFYGENVGVMNIDFTVQKSEIVGLLGPNGSGKTTIMKVVSGYTPPSAGTVVVDGFDILDNPKEVTNKIGFLPEIPPLYPEMRVKEYLHFIAAIKGVARTKRKACVDRIMEVVSVTPVRDRLIRNLSKGYKQRVGLGQAIIADPPILIFDEPTVGLDPKQINEVRQLIRELGKDHTVILSSHILAEVSMICERVIILNKGRVVAKDTIENLSSGIADTGQFILTVKGSVTEIEQILKTMDGITDFKQMENAQKAKAGYCGFLIKNAKGVEVREPLSNALARKNIPIIELRSVGMTLEDIFLQLIDENVEEPENS